MTIQIMPGIRQLKKPGVANNQRKFPPTTKIQAIEQLAAYQAALALVARIDEELTRRTRHYRNRRGVLLTCLDEVVRELLEAGPA